MPDPGPPTDDFTEPFAPRPPDRLPDRPRTIDVGDTLGPYRLLKLLGRGGMGAVFLADDPKLGRQVAVKTMRPDLAADPVAKSRFLREARATAAVEHDNIIPIFAVDEAAGTPFLVMPVLHGETLAARAGRPPALTLAEVCRIGRETALGLAAAHARGLVHRDIKPANLWLDRDTGRIKILDFGLARPQVAGDELPTAVNTGSTPTGDQLTQAGAIMGTPAYMAPEQAKGEPLDGRADLYSLGCVLYQLTTGRRPHRDETWEALLTEGEFHPPTPAMAVNPGVPAALSKLIDRMLARDRNRRPATATAVADTLLKIETTLAMESGDGQVVPMGVAPSRAGTIAEAFAHLDDGPTSRGPSPVRRSAILPLAVAAAAAVVAVIMVVVYLRPKPAAPPTETSERDRGPRTTPPPTRPTKAKPTPPVDPASVRPTTVGPRGPFDDLDPKQVPASERWPGVPAEVVAVAGSTAGYIGETSGATARLVFSPDGRWVCSPANGRVLNVDGTVRYAWAGFGFATFAPDSSAVVIPLPALNGTVVRRIDLTGTSPPIDRPISGPIAHCGIAFLPDGTLALSTNAGSLHLWDWVGNNWRERTLRPSTDGSPGPAAHLMGTPDGKQIGGLFRGANGTAIVRFFDRTDGTERFAIPVGPGVISVALSMDGQTLAVGRRDGPSGDLSGLTAFDLTGPTPTVRTRRAEGMDVHTVTQAGFVTVNLGREEAVTSWAATAGRLREVKGYPAHTFPSPDGTTAGQLQALPNTNFVHLRNLDAADRDVTARPPPAGSVAIGDGVVLTTPAGKPVLHAVRDGKLVAVPPSPAWNELPGGQLRGPIFSPDGRRLVGRETGNALRVFDVTGTIVRPHAPIPGEFRKYLWSADGTAILTVAGDFTLERWDVTKAPAVRTKLAGLTLSERGINDIAIGPTDKVIAYTDPDKVSQIRLVLLGEPKPIERLLTADGRHITYLAFTPDGRYLLAGTVNSAVLRFDLTTAEPTDEVVVKDGAMAAVVAPSRGSLLAVGNPGHDLRWYDSRDYRQLGHWAMQDTGRRFQFAPDGRHLLVEFGGAAFLLRLALMEK